MSNAWGYCDAFGCPLFGVYGSGGKWYCCCHRDADAGRNDAITLEICKHKNLVDQILTLRRTGGNFGEIENTLLGIVREAGQQVEISNVIGPTSGDQHFSETDA